MVIPVNSDKPITSGIDTPAQTNPGVKLDTTDGEGTESALPTSPEMEPSPDLQSARELFQLESNQLRISRPAIETADQARNLLDQIVHDISASPKDALKIQSGGSNGLLTKLLTTIPT